MEKALTQRAPREVKFYQSQLGSKVSIVMYQLGNKFGVVLKQLNGVVCAPNFGDENSSSCTFQGNEVEIIDWVDQIEATRRYTKLLLAEVNCPTQLPSTPRSNPPYLRLVVNRENTALEKIAT